MTSRNLLQKNKCSIACTPLSPKSHIYWPSPYLFGAVSQSYLKCSLPGCSPHFASNKTNSQLSRCAFFLSQQEIQERGPIHSQTSLMCLLADLDSLPQGLLSHTMAAGFPLRKWSKRGKRVPNESQSVYNLILEVIFLHFCCTLFTRREASH